MCPTPSPFTMPQIFKVLLVQYLFSKIDISTASSESSSFLQETKSLLSIAVTKDQPFIVFMYYSASSRLMKDNYTEFFKYLGLSEGYHSVQLMNISISNEPCVYEYSQKFGVGSRYSTTNHFKACRLTMIYVLRDIEEFIKLFITGHGHCLPYPYECTVEWSNYWIIVESNSSPDQQNFIVETEISLKLLLVLQNAVLLAPVIGEECCEIYMMMGYNGKWSQFEEFSTIGNGTYNEIVNARHRIFYDYEGVNIGVITPFRDMPQDVPRYKRTHIRSEVSYAPDKLTCSAVITSINATYKHDTEGSGKGSNEVHQFVLKSKNIITMPISITPERYHAYEFSDVILWAYINFVTRPLQPAGKTLTFLSQPFKTYVWISLFASWTLLSATIYVIILKIKTNATRHHRSKKVNIFAGVASALAFPLMDQSNNYFELEKKKNKNDGKCLQAFNSLLVCLWLLSVLVLSSLYKSKIVSFLVYPTFLPMPETFQELIESDYEIWVPPGFTTGSMRAYFDSMNNSFSNRFIARHNEGKTVPQCFEVLKSDVNRACVAFDIFISALANKVLISPQGQSMYRRPSDAINPMPSALGVSPYNHGLIRVSSITIGRLQQGGFIQQWLRIMESVNYQIGKSMAAQKSVSNNSSISSYDTSKSEIVSAKDIQLPIIILTIGIATSLLILVVELVQSVSKKRRLSITSTQFTAIKLRL
ncbi:unnamed protein product [Orchesella dallaii]|uniref:Uncharacterized protein n=1 Tax=Orchesella dallaii TaxID=48710 RepID=A0ABP1PQ95_9HEXA